MNRIAALGDRNGQPPLGHTTRYDIRFVPASGPPEPSLLAFADPAPTWAVATEVEPGAVLPDAEEPDAGLDLLCVPGQPGEATPVDELLAWVAPPGSTGAAPVVVGLQGTQVVWTPRRAALLAPPERMETARLALVEFCYYERELAKLERLVAESWPGLQEHLSVTFEVTRRDLERQAEIGQQVRRMLAARIAFARIVPHLNRPGSLLPTLANQLGERLRERTRIESRVEFLTGQLEVFERIYEMASQRLSEVRQSQQEQTLEWAIIILLAAETLLLMVGLMTGQ